MTGLRIIMVLGCSLCTYPGRRLQTLVNRLRINPVFHCQASWDPVIRGFNPAAAFSHAAIDMHAITRKPCQMSLHCLDGLMDILGGKDEKGFTALHWAAWEQQAEKVDGLIERGAHLDEIATRCGRTALHFAAVANATRIAEKLLMAGATQLPDFEGQLPLHAAAYAGSVACVKLFLGKGADVNALDKFGFSALRWACLNGHAEVALFLLRAGGDGTMPIQGLTPLALACAAGHGEVVEVLMWSGIRDSDKASAENLGCVTALEVAREMGHEDLVQRLQAAAAEEDTVQAMGSQAGAAVHSHALVQEVDASTLALNRSYWDDALTTSTPLLVRGFDRELAIEVSSQSSADLCRKWGRQPVYINFSPDELYRRPWLEDGQSPRLLDPPLHQMFFSDFVDLLPSHGQREFFAISQSPTELIGFEGLRVPPLLESLIECDDESSEHQDWRQFEPLKHNMWICVPPKLSALHYDEDDALMLQLSGTKHFTLVSPGPLHGLTTYPSTMFVDELERIAPGSYKLRKKQVDAMGSEGVMKLFPLVNVSTPDLKAHPLFRYAQVVEVDIHEGDALLLPAFWYHEVSSFSLDHQLNVAINFCRLNWDQRHPSIVPPSRLHCILREKLGRKMS